MVDFRSKWLAFSLPVVSLPVSMASFAVFISDKEFDKNFPLEIERLSDKHWAPATIVKRAAKFLVNKPGTKVLDIGSGAGKFCIIGAACYDGLFVGVEQRQNLCTLAVKIAQHYQLTNLKFIHANVVDTDFSDYDAFFFYNAFYENIEDAAAIDNSVALNPELFSLIPVHLPKNWQRCRRERGLLLIGANGCLRVMNWFTATAMTR